MCNFNPSIKVTCLRAQHTPRWVQAYSFIFCEEPLFFLTKYRLREAGFPQKLWSEMDASAVISKLARL